MFKLYSTVAVAFLIASTAAAPQPPLTQAQLEDSNRALIDINAQANVLGELQCSSNTLIGLAPRLSLGRLVAVCACVEIDNTTNGDTVCPECPANSSPICGDGACGCRCNSNFFTSTNGECAPFSLCANGLLSPDGNGTTTCLCPSGFTDLSNGGCQSPIGASGSSQPTLPTGTSTSDSPVATLLNRVLLAELSSTSSGSPLATSDSPLATIVSQVLVAVSNSASPSAVASLVSEILSDLTGSSTPTATSGSPIATLVSSILLASSSDGSIFPSASASSGLPLASVVSRVLFASSSGSNTAAMPLATSQIYTGNRALIDLTAVVDVLGGLQCSVNTTVGLTLDVSLAPLAQVCACVEVLNVVNTTMACPSCPSNASPICGNGICGCRCDSSFFATTDGMCAPVELCAQGILSPNTDGTTTCACPTGLSFSSTGGCQQSSLVSTGSMSGQNVIPSSTSGTFPLASIVSRILVASNDPTATSSVSPVATVVSQVLVALSNSASPSAVSTLVSQLLSDVGITSTGVPGASSTGSPVASIVSQFLADATATTSMPLASIVSSVVSEVLGGATATSSNGSPIASVVSSVVSQVLADATATTSMPLASIVSSVVSEVLGATATSTNGSPVASVVSQILADVTGTSSMPLASVVSSVISQVLAGATATSSSPIASVISQILLEGTPSSTLSTSQSGLPLATSPSNPVATGPSNPVATLVSQIAIDLTSTPSTPLATVISQIVSAASSLPCYFGIALDGSCRTRGNTHLGPSAGAGASQRSRSRRAGLKGHQSRSICPAGETPCQTPSGGHECLDLTVTLDSCGGCPGQGGVNCLLIEGVERVSCASSICQINSCFPGYLYKGGKCQRSL